MQELRRITNQADFNKDKKYKKFYIWATYRLLSVQLLNITALFAIIYLSSQIFQFWMLTGILMYKDICGLIIVCFYLFGYYQEQDSFLADLNLQKYWGAHMS